MSSESKGASDIIQLVSFTVGQEEFGADILKVREIIRHTSITHMPQAPAFIEGIINLRGKVVPVVDLRNRFGLPRKEQDKNTRIIVVDLAGQIIGFMVDEVREVLRVEKGLIEPPPELAMTIDAEYVTGVVKLDDRLLILLELERALTAREKQTLFSVGDSVPQEADVA